MPPKLEVFRHNPYHNPNQQPNTADAAPQQNHRTTTYRHDPYAVGVNQTPSSPITRRPIDRRNQNNNLGPVPVGETSAPPGELFNPATRAPQQNHELFSNQREQHLK